MWNLFIQRWINDTQYLGYHSVICIPNTILHGLEISVKMIVSSSGLYRQILNMNECNTPCIPLRNIYCAMTRVSDYHTAYKKWFLSPSRWRFPEPSHYLMLPFPTSLEIFTKFIIICYYFSLSFLQVVIFNVRHHGQQVDLALYKNFLLFKLIDWFIYYNLLCVWNENYYLLLFSRMAML